MRRDAAYSVYGLDDLAAQLGYGHSAATFDRRCLVVRCFAEKVLQLHTESSSVTKAVSHRSTAHEPVGPAETVAPGCTGSIRVAAGRRHEIGKRVQRIGRGEVYTRMDFERVSVSIFGEVAIASGIARPAAVLKGEYHEAKMLFTAVVVQAKDQPSLVVYHSTRANEVDQ